MDRNIFLAKWLHRFDAKRLSRPLGGSVFLPPNFGYQATFMGWVRKSFRLWKNPLYGVIPYRNKLHKSEQPIWVREELINKSCFSNASAKLQLGVSSSCSDSFNNSPNSSVIIGRLATVSYFSELG
jgi:hypothetical protein